MPYGTYYVMSMIDELYEHSLVLRTTYSLPVASAANAVASQKLHQSENEQSLIIMFTGLDYALNYLLKKLSYFF